MLRAIKEEDFDLIIQEEADVYPLESSLTKEILQNWYLKEDSFAEFGMVYENEDKSMAGFAIIMPFNKNSFKALCHGKMNELDSTIDDFVSKSSKEKETGLHFYHIHKFTNNIKRFYNVVLEDLSKIQKKFELKIIGCSALAVSNSGISLFYNTLNFNERSDNLNNEHLMVKNGTTIIVRTDDMKEIESKIKEGYQYQRRCKFLVSYEHEISQVWTHFNK
eukprot:gene11772-5110_t